MKLALLLFFCHLALGQTYAKQPARPQKFESFSWPLPRPTFFQYSVRLSPKNGRGIVAPLYSRLEHGSVGQKTRNFLSQKFIYRQNPAEDELILYYPGQYPVPLSGCGLWQEAVCYSGAHRGMWAAQSSALSGIYQEFFRERAAKIPGKIKTWIYH